MKTEFITKGEWRMGRQNPLFVVSEINGQLQPPICEVFHNYNNQAQLHHKKEEAIANAELIAQAGTVYNEIGLTPSELLDQRNELREALETMLDYPEEDLQAWATGTQPITCTFLPVHFQSALTAILKAKGNQ